MRVKANNDSIDAAKMAFASEDYLVAAKLYSDSIKYSKNTKVINTLKNEAEQLNTAKETFNLGKKLADDKDYLKAIEILNSAKIYKKTQALIDFCKAAYIQENLNMAKDYASKKHFSDAILLLESIITLDSNNKTAINLKTTYEKAIAYTKVEKDKAIETVKIAEKPKILTSKYKISVNTSAQKVEVYENEKLIKTMVCSTGTDASSTPKGNFKIGLKENDRGYSFYSPKYGQGAYYWVRFWGDYLFHSIPFDANRKIIPQEAQKLGQKASHGCVRLSMENAKWLYNTIPPGTALVVY